MRIAEDEIYPVYFESSIGEHNFNIDLKLWKRYLKAKESFLTIRQEIEDAIEECCLKGEA